MNIKFLVLDAQTGRRLQSFTGRVADKVNGIALNHDTTRLASIDEGGLVTFWDVNTGQEVLSLKTSQSRSKRSSFHFSFSPGGERFAVVGEDSVGIWSAVPFQDELTLPQLKKD